MRYRVKLVLLGLLIFVAGRPERAEGVLPDVRIGLLQQRQSISFSGPAGVKIQPLRGDRVIASAPAGEVWRVTVARGRLRIEDAAGSQAWTVRRGMRLAPPEDGVVTLYEVEGHWDEITERDYRGVIEVRRGRGGRLRAVNVIDVESYLRGVVPSEMPARYPLAALQAQAAAARGQAFMKAGRHRRQGFDLCAGPHCQVYGGATSEDVRSDWAVATTRGEVVVYRGRLANTLYSSNCGGHTANNEDYWVGQRPEPYLRGAPDFEAEEVGLSFPLSEEELREYLKYAPRVNCNRPRYARTSTIRWWSVRPREGLAGTLREAVGDFGDLLDVRVGERAESGMVRVLDVIGSRRLHRVRGGAEIRRALGGINSASFAVEPIEGEGEFPAAFVIWGAGWGHQVGMCQVGAAGLADKGWDYERILSKYYRGCEVRRRY